MEQEMSSEMMMQVVVVVIQSGILIIIGLISYIFKVSIDNIRLTFGASIDNILDMIKEMKSDRIGDIRSREKNDNEIYERLRVVESDVAILKSKNKVD